MKHGTKNGKDSSKPAKMLGTGCCHLWSLPPQRYPAAVPVTPSQPAIHTCQRSHLQHPTETAFRSATTHLTPTKLGLVLEQQLRRCNEQFPCPAALLVPDPNDGLTASAQQAIRVYACHQTACWCSAPRRTAVINCRIWMCDKPP